ncbi:MAG: XRE family transcriptional regulator [Comamonadaceae bacterium BICA1-1]|nr:MAG: XRE family transcriptional regulator [Comamonadaceae bacterium BICA1-1]
MLSPQQQEACARLGLLLARLRLARKVKQTDAALRAGLSRNTVYRLEKGDPGLALGQVLRYLEAIAPGCTLLDLLSEQDPALLTLAEREKTQRVRDLTAAERKELDF